MSERRLFNKKVVANDMQSATTWSEWRDLNSRPLDPQSSALPAAPHPDIDAVSKQLRIKLLEYISIRFNILQDQIYIFSKEL